MPWIEQLGANCIKRFLEIVGDMPDLTLAGRFDWISWSDGEIREDWKFIRRTDQILIYGMF